MAIDTPRQNMPGAPCRVLATRWGADPSRNASGSGTIHSAPCPSVRRAPDPSRVPSGGRLLSSCRRLRGDGARGRNRGGLRPGAPSRAALPASSRSPCNGGDHRVDKSRKCMGNRPSPTLPRGSELRNRSPATHRQLRFDAHPTYRSSSVARRSAAASRIPLGTAWRESPGELLTRLLSWCSGVSMLGR